jgi:hypothetical protein
VLVDFRSGVDDGFVRTRFFLLGSSDRFDTLEGPHYQNEIQTENKQKNHKKQKPNIQIN